MMKSSRKKNAFKKTNKLFFIQHYSISHLLVQKKFGSYKTYTLHSYMKF